MKESFWAAGLIIAGLVGIAFILLFQNLTSTDQQNYYLLKEISQAAMKDSLDIAYYRAYGDYRIYTEKFVENFVRRWSESADRLRTYKIEFYDIIEMPPKVSLRVSSNAFNFTRNMNRGNNPENPNEFEVVNQIDVILEAKFVKNLVRKDEDFDTSGFEIK